MSKKISEFFKATPKDQNSSNCGKISVNKVENLPEIRDCQVIIKDIKNQFQKEPKMFDEILLKDSKNSETKMIKKGGKSCKICGKESSSKANLFTHIKNIHADQLNILSCSVCSLKFIKQETLDSHMKNKHPNGQNEQFECDFDGKTFKTKGILHTHMKSHLPNVECHICDKIFKFTCLKFHLEVMHTDGKNFKCKMCSKVFKTAQYLRKHELTHNKKFQCEICKNVQSTQGQLNQHIKFCHENVEIYKCEKCSKEFKLKKCLYNHQKTHNINRPKPFKCQRCDFATDLKLNFNRHQKSHERQDKKFAAMKNPLKCEKCSTFHRNKLMLKQHMRRVHPEVQFQCDLCAKFFNTKSNFIRHMNVHIRK